MIDPVPALPPAEYALPMKSRSLSAVALALPIAGLVPDYLPEKPQDITVRWLLDANYLVEKTPT